MPDSMMRRYEIEIKADGSWGFRYQHQRGHSAERTWWTLADRAEPTDDEFVRDGPGRVDGIIVRPWDIVELTEFLERQQEEG
jgi:hypothetical protein